MMSKSHFNDITLDINFQLSTFDRDWREVEFKIVGCDDDDQEIILGSGGGYMISLPYSHEHLVDISDETSQACYDICSEFESFDVCGTLNYLVLTYIKIDEQFRKKGVGLLVMKLLSDFFWNYTILIRPHPIKGSTDDIKMGIKKLQKYWRKVGFEQSGKSPIFYNVCL